GFEWLDADDNGGNTVSYLRFADADRSGDVVAAVINFSGAAKEAMRIGVPRAGSWRVALDTSGFDEFFSASQADVVLEAEEEPWHSQPFSVVVRVAPLSAVFLVPDGESVVPVDLPLAEGVAAHGPGAVGMEAADLEADEARGPGRV